MNTASTSPPRLPTACPPASRFGRTASIALAVLSLSLPLAGCSSPLFSGPPPALPGSNMRDGAPASHTTDKDREPRKLASFTAHERERIAYVQPWVRKAATDHRLDPDLINAVIWVESRFDPRAKSPAGARGLMQLMPATASALARSMGRTRAATYDPEFNIAAGSLYLAKMRDRYDGDLRLALAAYNAGAGNVDQWIAGAGLPPRSEHYVQLVMEAKARFEANEVLPARAEPPTRIAVAPHAGRVSESTRPAEPTPADDEAAGSAEAPPAAEPIVPDPPVRYDLDKVESTYRPTIEPPPPIDHEPPPQTEPVRRPAPAPQPAPRAEPEGPVADVGAGTLPSVLD